MRGLKLTERFKRTEVHALSSSSSETNGGNSSKASVASATKPHNYLNRNKTSIECAGKNDSGKLKNSRVKIEKVFGKNAIHSSFTFLHLYNTKKEKCSLFSIQNEYKAALLGLLMLSLCNVILFKV